MKNKNFTILTSFVSYCLKHPDERFWQALRNWSNCSEVLIRPSKMATIDNKLYKHCLVDTFYFEGKDK